MKEKICEWTFEGDDKKIHVIKLDNTNRKGIIYLDNVLFGKLPRQGLSNFEYKFEVAGKKCSFVYLVADLLNFKAPRFAMDGKYVNYDTLVYIPVPKITIYGIFSTHRFGKQYFFCPRRTFKAFGIKLVKSKNKKNWFAVMI